MVASYRCPTEATSQTAEMQSLAPENPHYHNLPGLQKGGDFERNSENSLIN